MATLEEGLISYLEGYLGVHALVSVKIYHMTKPQTVQYPCITLQRIDTPFIHTMQAAGQQGTLLHLDSSLTRGLRLMRLLKRLQITLEQP